MSDPAIEAANRAGKHRRSALMPANTVRYHNGHWHRGSGECDKSDLSPLIYTTEELENAN